MSKYLKFVLPTVSTRTLLDSSVPGSEFINKLVMKAYREYCQGVAAMVAMWADVGYSRDELTILSWQGFDDRPGTALHYTVLPTNQLPRHVLYYEGPLCGGLMVGDDGQREITRR